MKKRTNIRSKDLIGEVEACVRSRPLKAFVNFDGRWQVVYNFQSYTGKTLRAALRKFVKAAKGGGK